ncbi:MAG: RNA polymerase sigma factor [Acidimicrobiales bacterium]
MGDHAPHPDEQALAARASTDFDAFAELYRHYLPRIHDFAHRRTGNVQAAEDICSATFESALRSIGRFRWRPGGLGPWLFRIASRQVVAHYRREGRASSDRGQAAMASLAPAVAPGVDEVALEDDGELRLALSGLNKRYQEAISLRYLAHLDTGDAAAAMGLTKAAFSVVLTRATKALQRELERTEGDTPRGGE